MPARPVHLLLVGGGHASVAALAWARRWTAAGARVTLVNDDRFLYYSGRMPEHLGGVLGPGDLRIDLLRWCLASGVAFVPGRAVALDTVRRRVRLEGGEEIGCDLAAFDIGAQNPGCGRAPGAALTKPVRSVERVNAWLRDLLERPQLRRSLVVVGGGPAGVELMLNVAARLRAARPNAARLTLLASGARLTPQFPAGMGAHLGALLRAGGVDVRLNSPVARLEEGTGERPEEIKAGQGGAVLLSSGERVPQDLTIWATGAAGQPLFAGAGLTCDAQGFVRVGRDLRVPGQPWLLAAGDAVAVQGLPRLDRSGVNAVKQGYTLRHNLERLLRAARRGADLADVRLTPFRPYPLASYILSTGRPEGVLAAGPLWLRGRPLLWLKHAADSRWVRHYQRYRPEG